MRRESREAGGMGGRECELGREVESVREGGREGRREGRVGREGSEGG